MSYKGGAGCIIRGRGLPCNGLRIISIIFLVFSSVWLHGFGFEEIRILVLKLEGRRASGLARHNLRIFVVVSKA